MRWPAIDWRDILIYRRNNRDCLNMNATSYHRTNDNHGGGCDVHYPWPFICSHDMSLPTTTRKFLAVDRQPWTGTLPWYLSLGRTVWRGAEPLRRFGENPMHVLRRCCFVCAPAFSVRLAGVRMSLGIEKESTLRFWCFSLRVFAASPRSAATWLWWLFLCVNTFTTCKFVSCVGIITLTKLATVDDIKTHAD